MVHYDSKVPQWVFVLYPWYHKLMCFHKPAFTRYFAPVFMLLIFISLLYYNLVKGSLPLEKSVEATIECDGAKKYVVHNSANTARCIDGSPPAYYHRSGFGDGKDRWIIFFEGGGWCYDLEACALRSKTILGSSITYTKCLSDGAMNFYMSSNANRNPMMHNWNSVLVKYCDGSSYAGDTVAVFRVRSYYCQWHCFAHFSAGFDIAFQRKAEPRSHHSQFVKKQWHGGCLACGDRWMFSGRSRGLYGIGPDGWAH